MKNKLFILSIIIVSLLFASCEKETCNDSREEYNHKYIILPTDAVEGLLGCTIEQFALSEPFAAYLACLDTFSVSYSSRVSNDTVALGGWFMSLEMQMLQVINEMACAFPGYANMDEYSRNELHVSAIDIACYGLRRAVKKLEAYIHLQQTLYAGGIITKEQFNHDTNAMIDAYNTQYGQNYPNIIIH